MFVYGLINRINGKVYIGQTSVPFEKRVLSHFVRARRPKLGLQKHLYYSMRRYGICAFSWFILDRVETKSQLDEKEQYWIMVFNSRSPHGYNLTDGGDGIVGYRHTKKTKLRMSGENSPWFGRHHSKETKEKIAAAVSGENSPTKRPEVRKKLSLSHLGENNPFFGKHHSAETKAKMSKNSGMKRLEIRMKFLGEGNGMFGKHHSKKTRKKISEMVFGRRRSEETKTRISVGMKRSYLLRKAKSEKELEQGVAELEGAYAWQ